MPLSASDPKQPQHCVAVAKLWKLKDPPTLWTVFSCASGKCSSARVRRASAQTELAISSTEPQNDAAMCHPTGTSF